MVFSSACQEAWLGSEVINPRYESTKGNPQQQQCGNQFLTEVIQVGSSLCDSSIWIAEFNFEGVK